MLMRISLILGIYKDLHILYPEPDLADKWVRLPNSNPLFGGEPALTLMIEGGSTVSTTSGGYSTEGAAGGTDAAQPQAASNRRLPPGPCLYPSRGILEAVSSPADLPLILELETWSNDRLRRGSQNQPVLLL